MTYESAMDMIALILSALPDDALPEPDRVEVRDNGEKVVWFGSTGRVLGTATTSRGEDKRRDPSIYRRDGAEDALEMERVFRLDAAHLAEAES